MPYGTGVAAGAVADRLAGEQPSRLRALLVSTVAGATVGVVAYRFLRGGEESGDEGEERTESE